MQKLFNQCPSCGGQLVITECKCPTCQLQMRGDFQQGPLSSLSEDALNFVKVFLSARGNLTEVERVLGISYPTIRNKLDEINSVLSRTVSEPSDKKAINDTTNKNNIEENRKTILQKVADGHLSAAEAVKQLKDMQG